MNANRNKTTEVIEPVDLVNPDIGGMAHLLVPTLPLVHLPNSMMRISRQPQGYEQQSIAYFPINIVSHRMAVVGKIMATCGEVNTDPDTWRSVYDHDFETVHPYHYSVLLEDHHITVDLTVTAHVSFLSVSTGTGKAGQFIYPGSKGGKPTTHPKKKNDPGI